MEPYRLPPTKLPDPWVYDTETLLTELGRIREIALRIPISRNLDLGPVNSVVDALWDLEQRVRYLAHLHAEGQRHFARRHTAAPDTHRARRTTPRVVNKSDRASTGQAA
jgi:hypothetical protein